MAVEVDFHIHSNRSSDGEYSPCEIVNMAKKKKIRAISITDHDSVAAYPEVLNCGKKAGIEIIPGVEMTTQFAGREFHLLMPFIDWKGEAANKIVTEVAQRRIKEAQARVKKLIEIGMDVRWKDVEKETGRFPPVGMTIAMAFLKRAKLKGNNLYLKYYDEERNSFFPFKFYKDYLMPGRSAAVPRQSLDILSVLKLAEKLKGVPVLAHPGAPFMQAGRRELSFLKEKGLKGIEVFTSYHSKRDIKKYQKLSKDLDLIATAGSDFHGAMKPGVKFGCIKKGTYQMVNELRKWRT